MRAAIPFFVLLLTILIVCACHKPEDEFPGPPAAEEPTHIPQDDPDISGPDTLSRDSTGTNPVNPADTTSINPDSISVNPDSTSVNPDTTSVHPDTTAVDPEPEPDTTSANDPATYKAGKFNDMPYRILLPKNFDENETYPLLIFLHGIGESGTDNKKQLTWGASLFQQDSIREKYRAIIVFPQCSPSWYWFDDWGINNLKGMTDMLQEKYIIDSDRIYIGGLSMGAYGTYAMVAEFPDLFAAAVAISGDGDARKAPRMAKTKWRIFAGKRDEIVSYGKSEKMANALQTAGASVYYTLYPGADHADSWIMAFEEPDFCSWIFSMRKNE